MKDRKSHNVGVTTQRPSTKSPSAKTIKVMNTRARRTRTRPAKVYEHNLLNSYDKVAGKVLSILSFLSMLADGRNV